MNLFKSLTSIVAVAAFAAAPAHSAELVVGAPTELADCVAALSSAFLAHENGTRLRFLVAPSEDVYAKIVAGEPIDVYMSSQMALQAQLLSDGKIDYESWTMYATGRLVLWTTNKRFDMKNGLHLLSDPAVKKIGTVDARSAYLLPTITVLDSVGLLDKSESMRTNSDTMQGAVKAVKAGKAQLAILSYETVLASSMNGDGKYYLIPEEIYKKNGLPGHAAVVTNHGKANPSAYRFIKFLKTPQAQAILLSKGFMKPSSESVDVR